jgi:hypothetical protein
MAQALPRPEKTVETANSLHLERWAKSDTTNAYLKVLSVILGIAFIVESGALLWALNQLSQQKVVVVRVNQHGQTEPPEVQGPWLPQERELKYFVLNFVKLYNRRIRATVRNDFETALYFLDGPLASAVLDVERKNRSLEQFLSDTSPEVDVNVLNVALEDLKGPTYRATVQYEKLYLEPNNHREVKREKFIGHIAFVIKDSVPVSRIPKNPLGLTVVNIREDQAF